jgi:hypothetical protein
VPAHQRHPDGCANGESNSVLKNDDGRSHSTVSCKHGPLPATASGCCVEHSPAYAFRQHYMTG